MKATAEVQHKWASTACVKVESHKNALFAAVVITSPNLLHYL